MRFAIPSVDEVIEKSVDTFKRFPLTLLSSFMATAIMIYFIEVDLPKDGALYSTLFRVTMVATLGIFLFTAASLLKIFGKVAPLVLSTILLVLYYFALPEAYELLTGGVIFFRHTFLLILFFIVMLWAPYARSERSNGDYWEYVKQLLFSFAMTALFTLVMISGVDGALYAVEKLFELQVNGKLYGQVNLFIVGIFSVGYFLSQIPREPTTLKQSLELPRVEKFFTKWVLTTLTGLYFVILYLYTFKVLATMEWPKGILAWLIVIFSAVAVLTYLFWTHFVTEQKSGWRRWIWLAILLQTIMLFMAIGMRIEEYSWTESRYMVVLLGLWLAGISLYFSLNRQAKIKWIFISLSTLLALSQVGPLSAYSISKKAQTDRLETMLVTLKKHKNPKKAPGKLKFEISDTIKYLYSRYGTKPLEKLLPKISSTFTLLDQKQKKIDKACQKKKDRLKYEDVFDKKPHYFPAYATDALGFEYIDYWEYKADNQKNGSINISLNRSYDNFYQATEVKGYDFMSRFYGSSYKRDTPQTQKLKNIGVMLYYYQDILEISRDKKSVTLNIKHYAESLIKKHGRNRLKLSKEELTQLIEDDKMRVKIEFENIDMIATDTNSSMNFSAIIFYKFKE